MGAEGDRRDIALLLRRAGFGSRPEEIDAAVSDGYDATVDRLLGELGQADSAADSIQPPDTSGAAVDAIAQWWMSRMVAANHPFREKLTLFWHGHFATSIEKVRDAGFMYGQNQTLRQLGAGNFEDLVQAIAKDPAMLIWLDANTNNKQHANENFARELMELFTMGIGNYTEDDVHEGARAFTGWSLNRVTRQYNYRSSIHDDGPKHFLGQTGDFSGEDVIHMVTHHPASPPFIAARVWSHLARPIGPGHPIAKDLAKVYGKGLDISALLGAVFRHSEFRTDDTRLGLVKMPIEYVVGTLRALRVPPEQVTVLASADGLGQLPFYPPSVGGWPQNSYWVTTGSAGVRLAFAKQVVAKANLEPVTSAAPNDRPAAAARLLGLVDGWSSATSHALAEVTSDPATLMILALVSPEYVRA